MGTFHCQIHCNTAQEGKALPHAQFQPYSVSRLVFSFPFWKPSWKICWQGSTPIAGTQQALILHPNQISYYFYHPSCLLSQGLVCCSPRYFLLQRLTEGSDQFFSQWEFRHGFLDTVRWFLKTSFSSDCFKSNMPFCGTAGSEQVLAMLTVSRWHKFLQLSTSTMLCRRVERIFPKPHKIIQPLWVVTGYTHLLALLTNATKSQQDMQNESSRDTQEHHMAFYSK